MPEFKSDNSVSRIMKNGLYTAMRFGTYFVTNVILIRFFIHEFGKSAFGLIALGGFLTQFIGIVSKCIGQAVARFMNISLNQNNWNEANEIFNTALWSNLIFSGVQLPFFALGIWKLDVLMDVPAELLADFRWLVIFNVLIFFLAIMKGAFFTPILAANRLDISDKFEIVSHIMRLALLISLILKFGPHLWIIGAVELAISLLMFGAGLSVYHKLVDKNIRFDRKLINWKWAGPVLNMAIWMLAFALGQVLFTKTDIWVLNRFHFPEMAGVYAALLVIPNFIRQIGNQVATLIAPVYMIDFAKENTARIADGCVLLSRLVSYFGAVVGGIVCGVAPLILRLWLGEDFVQFNDLLFILVLYVVLTLNKSATWPVFTAFNKVNQLGVTTLACGGLNIALSIGSVYLGWGAYGVALATLLTLFLLYGILYPWRVARILGIRFRQFLYGHLHTLVTFLLITAGVSAVMSAPVYFAVKLFGILTVLLVVALFVWKLLLSDHERQLLGKGFSKVKGMLNGLHAR